MVHQSTAPWVFFLAPDKCRLSLWTERGTVRQAFVWHGDPYDYLPGAGKRHALGRSMLKRLYADEAYDVWGGEIGLPTGKLRYFFECTLENEETRWLGERGVSAQPCAEDAFRLPYVFPSQYYQAPAWTGRSCWYQIFPDRFDGTHAPATSARDYQPQRVGFWGGTLHGVQKHIPYLRDLGVTGVYLNPVFESPSNHRYDTVDYRRVDPRLGTNEDLEALAGALHENGLRLMLDGVFNHASRACPQFQDVLRLGKMSRYWDWFIIYDEEKTCKTSLEELTDDVMKAAPPYEAFAFAANMPKWNTENVKVMEYLIGCAEEWTKRLRLDAWRLDVPDETGPRFLRAFRERIKRIAPQTAIIGEIWTDPSAYIQGDRFDGTMNYPLYFAIRDYLLLGVIPAEKFCERMNRIMNELPLAIRKNQMNFIANHDLPRPLTLAGGNRAAVCAALALVAMLDGEASLYYGDERGMRGGEDPENRGAVDWTADDQTIHACVRELLRLRKKMLNTPLVRAECSQIAGGVQACFVRADGVYRLSLYAQGAEKNRSAPENGELLLAMRGFEMIFQAGAC